MRKLILLVPLFMTGCASLTSLYNSLNNGINLSNEDTSPIIVASERTAQQQLECDESYRQFKEKYFWTKPNTQFQNIYMTLQSSDYDNLIARLKNEGTKTEGGRLVLKKNINKNDSLLLFFVHNELDTYQETAEQFLVGLDKRKKYTMYNRGAIPSFGLEWPNNANMCDSFADQDTTELVRSYRVSRILAEEIGYPEREREMKKFYETTGIHIETRNNLLAPYIRKTDPAPSPDYLYYLNDLVVFQSVQGGIFASLKSGLQESDRLIFIATNRQFANSAPLDNIGVLLTGSKTFDVAGEKNKRVYTFKIADTDRYNKILKDYYFYPVIKSAEDIDEATAKKIMQHLFTVVK